MSFEVIGAYCEYFYVFVINLPVFLLSSEA